MKTDLLKTYIGILVEKEIRQVHLSGNKTAEWGSDDHVADLEIRISDAAYWRDKHPRGSEKRGHYRNIYNSLKRELHSIKKKKQSLSD